MTTEPPPKPKLFRDNELTAALMTAKTPFLFVFGFNFASNLLYLALPIYTMQVYGRVLQSQSQETLLILTAGALFAFVIHSVIEAVKGYVLISFGMIFERALSQRVLGAMFDATLKGDNAGRSQALRDFDIVRQTATGGAVLLFIDLPFS